MPETVEERAERAARAFKKRRWAKSRKSDGFPWDDVVIGLIVGALGVVLAPQEEAWSRVAIGALSGLLGIGAWHLVIHPIVRWVWTVPIAEHVAQAEQIHQLDIAIRELESRVAVAEANLFVVRERQRTLDRLTSDISNGQAYLQFAERGEPIAVFLGYVNTWDRTTTVFYSEQMGSEAFRRFESAHIPKSPTRVIPYRPDDHDALARRIRSKLNVLESLRRTLLEI